MSKTRFILNTDIESLARWLTARWQEPAGNPVRYDDVTAWLRPPSWQTGSWQITAEAWIVDEKAGERASLKDALRFDLLYLERDKRLEVTVRYQPFFETYLVNLLVEMADKWPEMVETMEPRSLSARRRPAARDDLPTRPTRGKSRETDRNALEAYRLYQTGLTYSQIADQYANTEKTIGRWIKRAKELQSGT